MKKLLAVVLSILFCINSTFAFANANNDIPDEFTITERWLGITPTFVVETKTEKLGTLYRKAFSAALTYEFLDPNDIKVATARSKFFSSTAHFDLFDKQDVLLGMVEERFMAFYPTFDLYDKNGTTRLAFAKMNFWGTTFTVYDPETNQEMAVMQRPYFGVKNNWTFKMVNRHLLMTKNIDPRMLLTVIAFQSDREYWQTLIIIIVSQTLNTDGTSPRTSATRINMAKEKIMNICKSENITDSNTPDVKFMESVAKELEADYSNIQVARARMINLTDQDDANDFVDYCLNLVQSNVVSAAKKNAILHLLKSRFSGV